MILLLLAVTVPASTAPAPAPASGTAATVRERPQPLERKIAVTVRRATLTDVLARATAATRVGMTATAPAGDQRVTLHAPRVTVGELQTGLKDLLRLRVGRRSTGAEERHVFSQEPRQAAQAEAWRLRQAGATLDAIQRAARALSTGQETSTVRSIRDRFIRENPEFPEDAVAVIDAEFLRRTLLFTPLSAPMRGQLTRTGWLSLPLAWLPPADQELLAAFAQSGPGRSSLTEALTEYPLDGPRVQYRLLYGDRWSDRMLLAQVGSPGAWTWSMLPSILFRQKDDSALYPAAADRPDDPDVWRRLPPRFDIAGKEWDDALVELARTMQIRLAADSYARPSLFNTERRLPTVAGIPLRDALDRLCRERGYFWWKQDGWYFLRSRTWVEESRVAVPDRLLRGWIEAIGAEGVLGEQELLQMASLSDEQLLTLELQSRTPGGAEFLGRGFDPDQASLLASALLLFRSLPPAQRELVLTDGLPALWLPPAQQTLFAAVAAQHRTPLFPDEADAWSFRIRQEFPLPPEAEQTAPASSRRPRLQGRLIAEWRFGAGRVMRASLTLGDRPLHQTVDSANPPDVR